MMGNHDSAPGTGRGEASQRDAVASRLGAAQVVGSAVSGLLGQIAVDMPGGYFGPWDTTTPAGRGFVIAVLALAVIGVDAWLHRRPWLPLAVPLLPTLIVGAFLVPLAVDPVTAGLVVAWNMVLLGRTLFPTSPAHARGPLIEEQAQEPLRIWLETKGPALRHLVGVALVATVAVVGYEIGLTSRVRTLTHAGGLVVVGLALPFLVRLAQRRSVPAWLALVLASVSLLLALRPAGALTLLAASLAITLSMLVTRTALFGELLDHFFGRPALLVLVSFVTLIALGTMLLSFPAASSTGRPIAPVDALFTATSATCVTGLIVLDTPNDFSSFGKVVILALIQIGGLNIMVLSTFAAILLGRGLGLKSEQALGELLELHAVRSAYRLIVFIVVATLAVEGIGALILGAAFLQTGDSLAEGLWRGVFHSISAFCNAGFALQSDSLVSFQGQPLILITVAALITLGGLGFAVLAFTWLRVTGQRRVGLAVQVKVVLASSLVLLLVGWMGFGAVEWGGALRDLGFQDRLVNALFASVTARTAGFNSVDMAGLHPTTVLLMMVLMFIGASPGGTGGGIKTTTVVVLLGAIPAVARGRQRVVVFGRRMTLETVYRSAVIAVVGVLVVVGSAMLLLASQAGGFETLLFESVSAFGTVGLSLGATAGLNSLGKCVVTAVMLAGRVGPLALALLLGRATGGRLGYPEASLMVG